jgi:hypothetical protein
MKRIIPVLAIIICFFCSTAQETEQQPPDKKAARLQAKEQKKEEQQKKAEWMKEVTRTMIENRRFVLEADFLSGKDGMRVSVNPTINFIVIDSLNAVMQLGSSTGIGWNGLGGVTVEGKVTRYEVSRTEKKRYVAYSIILIVFTNIGTYDIHMTVTDDGRADATIRGTTSGQVSYSGILYPPEISKVYKGMSLY